MFGGSELLFVVLPAVFLGLLLLGLLVVATVFRGSEPDPEGRRPRAVYLLVVMLVALLTVVLSAAQIGSVLVRSAVDGSQAAGPAFGPGDRPIPGPSPFGPPFPIPGPSPFGGGIVEPPPFEAPPSGAPLIASFGSGSSTVADVLEAVVLGGLALVAYLVHRRWFEELLAEEGADG